MIKQIEVTLLVEVDTEDQEICPSGNPLLENVVFNDDGQVDYSDRSKTENTRVSYPIYHIDNIVKPIS